MVQQSQLATSKNGTHVMQRLDLTRRMVEKLDRGEAIISGIGNSSFDLAAFPRPENFYMMGSMGLATSIALGVALAQPKRKVFAVEGDGSILMNLGTFATIAAEEPANLAVVVWDNGAYQITGNQPTATALGSDIVAIARGSGIESSWWARDEQDFEQMIERARNQPGPYVIAARVDNGDAKTRPERDPVILKDRFMRGIGSKG